MFAGGRGPLRRAYRPGQSGHLLGGGGGPSVAEEPPNAQLDHDGAATQRFIRDAAAVTPAYPPSAARGLGWGELSLRVGGP